MFRLAVAILVMTVAGCSILTSKENIPSCSSDRGSICIEVTKGKKQIQAELEEMLMRHEGYRRHPYSDRDTQSIGYGRNLTTNGISKEEALYLLRNDIERITAQLSAKFPVFDDLTNGRRAVLISMAYGLGIDGISEFSLMWGNIERRDYERAALEIYLSDYCGQVGNRCKELADIMEKDGLNVAEK